MDPMRLLLLNIHPLEMNVLNWVKGKQIDGRLTEAGWSGWRDPNDDCWLESVTTCRCDPVTLVLVL